MISIKNVSKNYDRHEVLNNVCLEIFEGEIHGVIGESGSGKSTLLKTINRLLDIDSGVIWTMHEDVSKLSDDDLKQLRRKIGMMFQDHNLLTQLNVEANIFLPSRINNISIDKEFISKVIDTFNLKDKLHKFPHELSGGEKQRVALVRAISTKPEILLCDEPTSALDIKSTHKLLQLLQWINTEYNTTIVFVSHDLKVTRSICHRVSLINKGKIVDTLSLNPQPIIEIKDYLESAREELLNEY